MFTTSTALTSALVKMKRNFEVKALSKQTIKVIMFSNCLKANHKPWFLSPVAAQLRLWSARVIWSSFVNIERKLSLKVHQTTYTWSRFYPIRTHFIFAWLLWMPWHKRYFTHHRRLHEKQVYGCFKHNCEWTNLKEGYNPTFGFGEITGQTIYSYEHLIHFRSHENEEEFRSKATL